MAMKRNRILMTTLLLLAPLALLTAGAGFAQTPDGETPAEETVCDIYSGAAFGLCNAYCEAMDCELLFDDDPETSPNASATACMKVLDNFIKITGEELTCEVEDPCPPDNGGLGCPCDDMTLFCGEELICDEAEWVCVEDNGGA
jgi:hypothetical protein